MNSNNNNNYLPNQASGYYAGPIQNNMQSGPYEEDYSGLPYRVSSLRASCVEDVHDSSWIGDSGAGKHMTPHREWFTKYTPLPFGRSGVEIGNKAIVPVAGAGSVEIVTNKGESFVLSQVLHVPGVKFNLFSLREVTRKGYTVTMVDDNVFVNHGPNIILSGTAAGSGNYKMNFSAKSSVLACPAIPKGVSIQVWHQRLGHTNYTTVKQMIDQGQVDGLICVNCNPPEICEPCVFGKMTRKSFETAFERASQPGELIHFDIAGPFEVRSIGHANFLSLFVDDLSGMTFVFPLKHKSEILQAVKHVIAIVKSSGHQLKRMRSDNALEFRSKAMEDLLLCDGIVHEYSAPYYPEQNGRAERQNRTIIEMLNTLKADAKLPKFLWAELANTAAYIRNFIPLIRLNGKTPFEIWFGRKPNVSHLRVVGSRAFAHAPHRLKLDNRAEEFVLVGYESKSHSYRLWNPKTNAIKVSPSVKFIEPHMDSRNLTDKQQDVPSISNHSSDSTECIANRTRGKSLNTSNLPLTTILNLSSASDLFTSPQSYEEAVQSPQSKEWKVAMEEEIQSLHRNGTWHLVEPSECTKSPLKSKWVYKTKLDQHGNISRFKARLCVKGCSQKYGIDYVETFSPVARYETIRTLLAVAANKHLNLKQFDIGTAFLSGELEEEIYMCQPEGFSDGTARVCRLDKSLYGLKQAPRAWNSTFDRFLQSFGLVRSSNDPCLYTSSTLFLVLYVDDGLIAAQSGGEADKLIHAMQQRFDVKTTDAQFYLGMQIERNFQQKVIKIHQQFYIHATLEKFGMTNCNPVSTPSDPGRILRENQGEKSNVPYRQIIGSLMYLTVSTRPDIAFVVSKLSQYLESPSNDHWLAAKRVLAYLKGTSNHGVLYNGMDNSPLKLYTDADFAMCLDTRKSTSGVVITLFGSPISWISRKQGVVTDSTTYAEYVAAHDGAREIVWMRQLLEDFGCGQINPTPLFCDNEAASKLIVNSQFHQRSKHIDTQYHYVRDIFNQKKIDIVPISTKKQLADLFTKPLAHPIFQSLKSVLNIV